MFSKKAAKSDMQVDQITVPVDAGDAYSNSKGGTSADQADMFRMGKVQELKVCCRPDRSGRTRMWKDLTCARRETLDSSPYLDSP